jgi:hypothetical protein
MGFDISTIQQASVEAINEHALQVMFGKVVSLNPLKIKVSDTWTLSEEFIVLDSPVENGEEVIILQYSTGNKYLVLSTVEKVYESSVTLGGVVATGTSVSDKVWNYLTSSGFSDEVAAGILGNMMTECGGNTLNLQWDVRGHYYGHTFYGLCQWCVAYFPSVNGRDVQGQLDFLMSNIASQINAYGFNYASGFNFSKFKTLGVEQAAVAFAVCYERPGYETNNYEKRRMNALTAYRTYHK